MYDEIRKVAHHSIRPSVGGTTLSFRACYVALLIAHIATTMGCAPRLSVPARPSEVAHWYVPTETDYRSEYERDAANRRRQSWGEYWAWVGEFYSGTPLSAGWTDRCKASVGNLKDATLRFDIQKQLNTLGLDISREWAKDNGVRKIDTGDVMKWGGELEEAKRRDSGGGHDIKVAVDGLQDQVNHKLRRL